MDIIRSTDKYSDLQIICNGRNWKVHRAVCCVFSKVIAAAVDTGFMEAQSGVYDMGDDHDPKIVEQMIDFMYKNDYADEEEDTPTPSGSQDNVGLPKQDSAKGKNTDISSKDQTIDKNPILINTQVFIIANKYDVSGLEVLAIDTYSEALSDYWNSSAFVASLELVCNMTSESHCGLSSIAVKAASDHTRSLVDRGDFTNLCSKNAQLEFDLFKASVSRRSSKPPKSTPKLPPILPGTPTHQLWGA